MPTNATKPSTTSSNSTPTTVPADDDVGDSLDSGAVIDVRVRRDDIVAGDGQGDPAGVGVGDSQGDGAGVGAAIGDGGQVWSGGGVGKPLMKRRQARS